MEVNPLLPIQLARAARTYVAEGVRSYVEARQLLSSTAAHINELVANAADLALTAIQHAIHSKLFPGYAVCQQKCVC